MNDRIAVSDSPGRIIPKKSMVKAICPEIGSLKPKYVWGRFVFNLGFGAPMWKVFRHDMWNGDSNPALVVSIKPLLVAAYSFDCDATVLIRFPDEFVERFQLRTKSRLFSVNMYSEEPEEDVALGPMNTGRWRSFMPRIANFLTDNKMALAQRTAQFSDDKWERVWEQAVQYAANRPHRARSANPMIVEFVNY